MRNIPNKPGWIVYKFEDFVDNIREQVMPTKEDSKKYIGLEHLDSGSLHVRRWGTKIQLKGTKFRMKKGDLLFARRNAYLRRVAIAPHDGLFSAHGMIFRSKNDVISPDFLPFFLSSDVFMDRAIKISVGSLSPTINWGTLRHEEFSLPPLDEQKRLADLLWSVDDSINKYCNLLKKTEVCAKSFIKKVIEQGEEKVVELIDVCDIVKDKPQDFKGEKKYYSTGAVHASAQDEYELITFRNKPSRANVYPKINDTGFAVMKNTKKIIFIDGEYNSSVFSTGFVFLRAKENILPMYLYYIVRSDFFQNQKDKKAVPGIMGGIRKNDIKKIKFPLFANNKQYEIVARLDSFELIINETKKMIIAMKNIQKQIINQIFGGKS